jgi:NADPH:quinone reductase
MKAIQCVEWGDPSKLVLADLPLPEPGAAQVRIRIAAAGVNFPDALIVQKKYQLQPKLPFVPGTEVAGTIDAVGTDVQHLKVGDRVIAFVGVGGFAEYVCAPAALAVPIPDGVSDEVAAAFTLTYATSHHALFDRGQLKAGETLLVLGAGGGVGLAAVELGKVAGARVIAAASSADKLAAAKEHGADELIDYAATDLRESVKALTGGNGADVIYDPVGGPGTEAAVRSLAWRGRLLIVGFAQGEIPQIPAKLLLLKGASAVGLFWGEFAKREPKANFAMLKELFGWLKEGKLKPHVSQVYPLAEAPRALDALLARNVIGKLVIRPQL